MSATGLCHATEMQHAQIFQEVTTVPVIVDSVEMDLCVQVNYFTCNRYFRDMLVNTTG